MTTKKQRVKHWTATFLAIAAGGLVTAGTVTTAANAAKSANGANAKAAEDAKVARGRHLVNTSGCHDCHTPFKPTAHGAEPDLTRMLSGHPETLVMPPAPKLPPGPWMIVSSGTNTAHAGPWGTTFTANLTPDKETGLGQWTVQNFIDTFRTGRRMGRGRPVMPPMPVPVYAQMPDEDLAAIFAYLQTLPPIKNRVPQPLPPAPALSRAD